MILAALPLTVAQMRFHTASGSEADVSVGVQQLHVPASRIHVIVLERRGITANTALRLSRFFGGEAQSWLNLQAAYELRMAERDEVLQEALRAIKPHLAARP